MSESVKMSESVREDEIEQFGNVGGSRDATRVRLLIAQTVPAGIRDVLGATSACFWSHLEDQQDKSRHAEAA